MDGYWFFIDVICVGDVGYGFVEFCEDLVGGGIEVGGVVEVVVDLVLGEFGLVVDVRGEKFVGFDVGE